MKKKLVVFTSLVICTITAYAPIAFADGYGKAGCGLGAVLFDDGLPVLAATSNGLSGNQTFAISSGTSRCDDTSGGEASAKAFIETNREALAKDIARGSGETISSLSTLAGCTDEAAMGASLQKSFGDIFPDASVSNTDVSESVINVLKNDAALSCNLLSSQGKA